MSYNLSDNLLRVVIKTFYGEYEIIIIDYILFHRKPVEEHRMVQELSLPSTEIRKALGKLQSHNILSCQSGKRDKRHDQRSGNMFTRGPDQGKMVYWSLDPDYKDVIAYRIIELQNLLENLEKDASIARYICPRCEREYEMNEVFPKLQCNQCPETPLQQKESEMEEARIKKNQGLDEINHLGALMRECLDQSYSEVAPRQFSSKVVVRVKQSEVQRPGQLEQHEPIQAEILAYYKALEDKAKKGQELETTNGKHPHTSAESQLVMTDGQHALYVTELANKITFL